MRAICVDTAFLVALSDERDSYHQSSWQKFDEYFEPTSTRLLLPWPILYEAVNTKLSKHQPHVEFFGRLWRRFRDEKRLDLLDDSALRTNALIDFLDQPRQNSTHYRNLSLVDRVIRSMLADRDLRFEAFITSNPGDFVDVCRQYRRTLIELTANRPE